MIPYDIALCLVFVFASVMSWVSLHALIQSLDGSRISASTQTARIVIFACVAGILGFVAFESYQMLYRESSPIFIGLLAWWVIGTAASSFHLLYRLWRETLILGSREFFGTVSSIPIIGFLGLFALPYSIRKERIRRNQGGR